MKRTPLRQVSSNRARENGQRAKAMEIVRARDGGRCRGLNILPEKCFGDLHGHELKKSSAGGSRIDPANVILLCDFHNGWIEIEPDLAHALGFVIRRGEELQFGSAFAPVITLTMGADLSDHGVAESFGLPFLGEVS